MVNKYDNYELKKVNSLENVPGTIKDGNGYIWDPSELPDKDFDDSKVPLEFRRLAIWMRSKLFGKEVRETIARLAEMFGINFKELMDSFESLDDRQETVESFIVDFIQSVTEAEINSGPEIVQARGGKAVLGQRLDETDARLAQTESDIETITLGSGIIPERFPKLEGEVDDTGMLQRVFNYIMDNQSGRNNYLINLEKGKEYIISEPLNFNIHKYTTINGYGSAIKVSDAIPVSNPMDCMLDIRTINPTLYLVGYLIIDGVRFRGNNRALKLVDALNIETGYGIYYSKFINVIFSGIRENGIGLNGVSWGVEVSGCTFLGYGEDPENDDTHWRGTGLIVADQSNGVWIQKNNFARLERAIEGASFKVSIRDNIFDYIKKAPIKFYGKSLSIKDNYFEYCGGENEEVERYNSSPWRWVNPVIIFIANPEEFNIGFNLKIEDNEFVLTTAREILAIDRVRNIVLRNNDFSHTLLPGGKTLVSILSEGMASGNKTIGNGLLVEGNTLARWYPETGIHPLFKNIITAPFEDLPNGSKRFSDIVIKDCVDLNNNRKLPPNLYKSTFISDASIFPDYTIAKETVNHQEVYKFTKNNNNSHNSMDLNQYLDRARGSYIRINFETINTQLNAPIRFAMSDGLKNILYHAVGDKVDKLQDWEIVNSIFYVDPDATELRFSLPTYASIGESFYLKNFSLTPAHYDLGYYDGV